MRRLLLSLSLVLAPIPAALADIGIGIGISVPGVSIGINLPAYPSLVQVPGYPVYYNPRGNANYFFYDGQYWVFRQDNWYASSWYNGPWVTVHPDAVPLYVLRVPVRYYRAPPPYFRGWQANAAPRWGDHWGSDWDARHMGWNQWSRNQAPRPAPLPTYQRQYGGERYPGSIERQHELRTQNYRYQPREPITQQHYNMRESPRGNSPERGYPERRDSPSGSRDYRNEPQQQKGRSDHDESQGKGRDH